MIYFVQRAIGGAIKIGHASNVAHRVASLQVANVEPIRLLGVADGGAIEEAQLHQELSEYRIAGEWFSDSEAVRSVIANRARPYDGGVDLSNKTNAKIVTPHAVEEEFRRILRAHPDGPKRLAEKTGLTPRALYGWMNGTSSPSFRSFFAIASVVPELRLAVARWLDFDATTSKQVKNNAVLKDMCRIVDAYFAGAATVAEEGDQS